METLAHPNQYMVPLAEVRREAAVGVQHNEDKRMATSSSDDLTMIISLYI